MNHCTLSTLLLTVLQVVYGGDDKVLNIMHLTTAEPTWDPKLNADFAFHLSNQLSDILPGYTINTTVKYAETANVGQSVKSFIEEISHAPNKIAILGPFYTSQAKVVAETASYYNLVQVAYSVTSPVMSNKAKFPYFARTIESTALHNPAIVKLLNIYGWAKVATISQDLEYVIGAKDDLQQSLFEDNVTILASTTYANDISSQLTQIRESKAKIIIGFLLSSWSNVRHLCRIYKEGLYGQRFQWLFWSRRFAINLDDLEQDIDDGCTKEQVKQAAEGIIYFHPASMTQAEKQNRTSDSIGYTYDEVEKMYQDYLTNMMKQHNQTLPRKLFPFTFDAAWSLALALNTTQSKLNEMGQGLEDFSYDKNNYTKLLDESLKSQKFFGLSGSVSFDSIGDRINYIVIYQIQNSQEVALGEYSPITDVISWYPGHKILFQGSHPPYDSDITVLKEMTLNKALVNSMRVISVIGMLYCIISVVVAFKYRKTKLIKLSSPRINSLIATGCCISYIDILLFGLDSSDVADKQWICSTRVWLLVIAFTFAFGSMFSKTWRVHVLFTNKNLQRKIVKDFHLVLFVLVILGFDVILLVLWEAIDPPHWETVNLNQQRDINDPDIITQTYVRTCTSNYSTYWLGILYGFKGLLLIFGIFFAWETRKVRIEALNDSKQIGISVYNVMVMSVISVPLVNLLSVEQLSIIFGITSISIIVCATATMTLVYGTKIYLILAHGNKVDDVTVQLPFQSTLKEQQSAKQSEPSQTSNNASTLMVPGSSNAKIVC